MEAEESIVFILFDNINDCLAKDVVVDVRNGQNTCRVEVAPNTVGITITIVYKPSTPIVEPFMHLWENVCSAQYDGYDAKYKG